jgi:putative transposase
VAVASGDPLEGTMKDEYTDRTQAIKLRLTGASVAQICHTVGHGKVWFHKWWSRYLEFGPEGLFDLTRANHQVVRRISPELERTILTIRRRLESRSRPDTRYRLMGATAILAELKTLQYKPLPCTRTIERVLQRHGLSVPKIRLARALPKSLYPGPQAHDSNQLHQIDLVGPIYLKGQQQRYYIFVCKDIFDGAVCLKLSRSRQMDQMLVFLGDCWKTLGRPDQVQFDNAREFCGWGHAARHLSRVIRLCLRFDHSIRAASRISMAGSSPCCCTVILPARAIWLAS